MGFIKLNCPNCGANIELDESREFGFCQYCGTKIVQDKIIVEHRGNIKIDHSDEINNLLYRAQEMMNFRDYKNAEFYYNKVLELDPYNMIARNNINFLYSIVTEPNLTLTVSTGHMYNKNAQLSLKIDNSPVVKLSSGTTHSFLLVAGKHQITVHLPLGSKKIININVNNRFEKFGYELKCKIGNTVEIIKLF